MYRVRFECSLCREWRLDRVWFLRVWFSALNRGPTRLISTTSFVRTSAGTLGRAVRPVGPAVGAVGRTGPPTIATVEPAEIVSGGTMSTTRLEILG